MSGAKPFAAVRITDEFKTAFDALDEKRRKQANKTLALLAANPAHPGLRTHPIKPSKHFWEAYLNEADRIIYRRDGPALVLVDIVKHDDIGGYGKAP